MKIKLLSLTSLFPALVCTPIICNCGGKKVEKLSYRVEAPKDTGAIKQTNYKKVFILSGQSNAVGNSRASYLKKKIPAADYSRFESGISKVQIAECNDWSAPKTFDFKPTTFREEESELWFGIELGFADILDKKSTDDVYIIKCALNGSSLNDEWLFGDSYRGLLYNNMIPFIKNAMAKLDNAKICGFCWMQGESDTLDYRQSKYLKNLQSFVKYLNEDLAEYLADGKMIFVDAGITDEFWGQYYDNVNYAKIQFWKESPLHGYFSTSENGLKTDKEPEENPDKAHYDSDSELLLGQWFAYKTIELFNSNH